MSLDVHELFIPAETVCNSITMGVSRRYHLVLVSALIFLVLLTFLSFNETMASLDARYDIPYRYHEAQTESDWTQAWGINEMTVEPKDGFCDESGNIHIVGSLNHFEGENVETDFLWVKFSGNGTYLNHSTYDLRETESAEDIVIDSIGNIYLIGYSWRPFIGYDGHIICFNASGQYQWIKTFPGYHIESGDIDSSDNLVIYALQTEDSDGYLGKYDVSGNGMWNVTWTSDMPVDSSVVVDETDHPYLYGTIDDHRILFKFDDSGNQLWNRTATPGNYTNSGNLELDSSGNPYVSGWTKSHLYAHDEFIFVSKYDDNGDLQWTSLWESPPGEAPACFCLTVEDNGMIGVLGYLYPYQLELWVDPDGSIRRTVVSELTVTSEYIHISFLDNDDNLVRAYNMGYNLILTKTYLDVTGPTIDGVPYYTVAQSPSGALVSWNFSDSSECSYVIYVNGSIVDSGQLNSTSISFNMIGMQPGTYNVTLLAFDWRGNTASETMMVVLLPLDIIPIVLPWLISMVVIVSIATSGWYGRAWYRTRPKKEPTPKKLPKPKKDRVKISLPKGKGVQILRGGEFVGNRLRYKVKVLNDTKYIITDVTVTLLSYPRDSLTLDGDVSKRISKIESGGFRSPSFEFSPTQDCVKGEVIASISYVDHEGKAHSQTSEPYIIRAVCDLLSPESITPADFELKLASLQSSDSSIKVDDWSPEEMREKAVRVLKDSNFYQVSERVTSEGEETRIQLTGWAKGKYTGKHVGVSLIISGIPETKGAVCNLGIVGEDDAMMLPAIDELTKKLNSWLCPQCSGILPLDVVLLLKKGDCSECPFCGVVLES
ncbi:MAG: hypothetical protein ACFFEJ_17230 [Candidatus Thorarchaeota archaeon]